MARTARKRGVQKALLRKLQEHVVEYKTTQPMKTFVEHLRGRDADSKLASRMETRAINAGRKFSSEQVTSDTLHALRVWARNSTDLTVPVAKKAKKAKKAKAKKARELLPEAPAVRQTRAARRNQEIIDKLNARSRKHKFTPERGYPLGAGDIWARTMTTTGSRSVDAAKKSKNKLRLKQWMKRGNGLARGGVRYADIVRGVKLGGVRYRP